MVTGYGLRVTGGGLLMSEELVKANTPARRKAGVRPQKCQLDH